MTKKVYAENMGKIPGGGQVFSSDYFLYARACVVANGKDYYEKILVNPAQMPKDFTFESLLYLAADAYKRKNRARVRVLSDS
ncbi:MAG: DUF4240 domain-containing protein [Lewinellaceae bacterium]|nr:DUF4240 domain-containing protein [Lewinellaceae bacterium]